MSRTIAGYRLLAVLVVAMLALAGCGGNGSSDDQPTNTAAATTPSAAATASATATPMAAATATVAEPTPTATESAATATEPPAATATAEPTSTPEPIPTPDVTGIGTLTAVIPTGANPWDVALAAGSAWVSDDVAGTVVRIDPATNEVIATIAVSHSGLGGTTLIAATDEAIWVVNEVEATITRIDPVTNKVVDVVAVPSVGQIETWIQGLAVGFGSLWVSDFSSNSRVVRLNPETGAIEAEIPTDLPLRIAVSAEAVWVVNYEEFTLSRIDPATNQVVAAIPVGGSPVTVAAGDGAIWVGNRSSGSVSRVDPAMNQEVADIALFAPGSTSTRIQTREVSVGLGAVWATDGFILYRIDPATNTVVASAQVEMTRLAAGESDLWITSPPSGVLRVTPTP